MSNFMCEKCGALLLDTPNGYITGCIHYPKEKKCTCPMDLFQILTKKSHDINCRLSS